MIRIAFIVHSFDAGGLERCVAHLADRLDPDRFRPMVICLDRNGQAAQWIERSDAPIVELHKPPGNSLRIVRRLSATFLEHGVDVAHSHNWGTLLETSLACRRLRGVRGVRHVHAEHGLELDEFRVRGWKRHLRRMAMGWAMNRADAVVACAESVRKWICGDCGLHARRVQVITNGVSGGVAGDSSTAAAIRQRLGIRPDSFVLGSVGRLVPLKDFGACIQATAMLAQQGVDAHFVLIGDGPAHKDLEMQAESSGAADRVHFALWQPAPCEWLPMFDVYVNSSRTEAMNLGILEAMAAGLPVVATDVGDTAWMIGGEDPVGILVPSNDPVRLAAALRQLAGDCAMRKSLAVNAQARYQAHYTVERMCDRYTDLYESLRPAQRTAVAL